MSQKLKDWLLAEKGRVIGLSEHLCITQPNVSNWTSLKNKRDIPLRYAKKIIEFTGLHGADIYPELHDVFLDSSDFAMRKKYTDSLEKHTIVAKLMAEIEQRQKEIALILGVEL